MQYGASPDAPDKDGVAALGWKRWFVLHDEASLFAMRTLRFTWLHSTVAQECKGLSYEASLRCQRRPADTLPIRLDVMMQLRAWSSGPKSRISVRCRDVCCRRLSH